MNIDCANLGGRACLAAYCRESRRAKESSHHTPLFTKCWGQSAITVVLDIVEVHGHSMESCTQTYIVYLPPHTKVDLRRQSYNERVVIFLLPHCIFHGSEACARKLFITWKHQVTVNRGTSTSRSPALQSGNKSLGSSASVHGKTLISRTALIHVFF